MTAFNVVPQSWWATYTRALMASRGTPHWIDQSLARQQVLRDAWASIAANTTFTSKEHRGGGV